MPSRRLARLGLMAASVLIALSAVEGYLRISYRAQNSRIIVHDSVRGWVPRAGASGWVTGENRVWVQINSDGLRDREYSRVKPANTVRVAVLGDSVMQGLNVPLEKTFDSYLEGNLSQCLEPADTRAETLNFGVSGYSTAQALLTYRHHASLYRPEVVMLALFFENDVYDNSPDLGAEPRPYFRLDGDRLILDESATAHIDAGEASWRGWRMWATERSEILRLLYDRLWVGAGGSPPQLRTGSGNSAGDGELYRPPQRPELVEAWRITEALLDALNREVRAGGSRFWIVTLANALQVDPDESARQRRQRDWGVPDLYYPDRRVRAFAESRGIPVITLAPALADYAAEHQTFLNGGYNEAAPFGQGHWNETANREAARLVSARLCDQLLAVRP